MIKKITLSRRQGIALGAGVTLVVLLVVVTGAVFLSKRGDKQEHTRRAAVVTNGIGCSEIGISILRKGGNAVESVIATLFCEGLYMPQSMGLGGGFFMTIYNRTTGEVVTLNAREAAPNAAFTDMFAGMPPEASQIGGKAVAIPGELMGYWRLYQRYGQTIPWKDLVTPSVEVARNGIVVTKYLETKCEVKKHLLYADPVLREDFIDKSTNDTFKEGQIIKRPRLARTLEIIAEEGGMALHDGSLTKAFVDDMQNNGVNITVEDMKQYRPRWEEPVKVNLNGQVLYTSPSPSSGSILSYILNTLKEMLYSADPNSIVTNQRIVEAMKHGYGARTHLGDPKFLNSTEKKYIMDIITDVFAEYTRAKISDVSTSQDPKDYGASYQQIEDHGTAHVSVLAPNGDAVAVTSTINFLFGAGIASRSTGIILNDEMDDFSRPDSNNGFGLPPSPSNFIKPGKIPVSSMCPSILVKETGDVSLIVGAAGGSKIISAVALVIIRHIWFNMDLEHSVNEERFHHQLVPMLINFEAEYATEAPELVEGLGMIGHNYTVTNADGFAAVTAITTFPDIEGVFDKRRSGSVSYIED